MPRTSENRVIPVNRVANKKGCWCWRCVRHRDQSFEWHPKLWEAHRNLTLNFRSRISHFFKFRFFRLLSLLPFKQCVNTCALYFITAPFCLSRSRTLDSSNARSVEHGWTASVPLDKLLQRFSDAAAMPHHDGVEKPAISTCHNWNAFRDIMTAWWCNPEVFVASSMEISIHLNDSKSPVYLT